MLVACALVLWSVGVSATTAQAANLVSVSNTLSDSGPSVTSAHDIRFTIPAGSSLASGQQVSITFPAGFTGVSSLVTGNLTVTVNGGAATHTGFSAVGAPTITFAGITATSGDIVRVRIADGVVTNPAVINSYEFTISLANAGADIGRTRVAIVNYVTVTAIVETLFEFQVFGLATTSVVNGTSTTGSSTPTQIPFGVLNHGVVYTLGQELTVRTNARNGFVVTVEQDGGLRSSNGADIDSFTNGTNVSVPAAWVAPNALINPAASLLNENMWGHWGLTSNDASINGIDEFNTGGGGDRWVAASTTPRAIFTHNAPADGVTQNYGLARVGYRVQISPLQEAAADYQTTLMYIATPTF